MCNTLPIYQKKNRKETYRIVGIDILLKNLKSKISPTTSYETPLNVPQFTRTIEPKNSLVMGLRGIAIKKNMNT